jgi:hypothetical protein
MGESKSARYTNKINAHSEKMRESAPNKFKRLALISERDSTPMKSNFPSGAHHFIHISGGADHLHPGLRRNAVASQTPEAAPDMLLGAVAIIDDRHNCPQDAYDRSRSDGR